MAVRLADLFRANPDSVSLEPRDPSRNLTEKYGDCSKVLDPAYAPGMGIPEPVGMWIRELFPMLRAVGIATDVVGMEMVEVNPLTDNTYRSKLVAVRALREMLTDVAMRKKGITDPFYVDSDWKDHGGN